MGTNTLACTLSHHQYSTTVTDNDATTVRRNITCTQCGANCARWHDFIYNPSPAQTDCPPPQNARASYLVAVSRSNPSDDRRLISHTHTRERMSLKPGVPTRFFNSHTTTDAVIVRVLAFRAFDVCKRHNNNGTERITFSECLTAVTVRLAGGCKKKSKHIKVASRMTGCV